MRELIDQLEKFSLKETSPLFSKSLSVAEKVMLVFIPNSEKSREVKSRVELESLNKLMDIIRKSLVSLGKEGQLKHSDFLGARTEYPFISGSENSKFTFFEYIDGRGVVKEDPSGIQVLRIGFSDGITVKDFLRYESGRIAEALDHVDYMAPAIRKSLHKKILAEFTSLLIDLLKSKQ